MKELTISELEKMLEEKKEQERMKSLNIPDTINDHVGEYVIIRTYSAGVWFGKLEKKVKNEVILTEARRMYYWHSMESISLSGVALYGIDKNESKICGAIDKVWLEAIEILSLSDKAIKSLKNAPIVQQN